jgi:hypothetical protein
MALLFGGCCQFMKACRGYRYTFFRDIHGGTEKNCGYVGS